MVRVGLKQAFLFWQPRLNDFRMRAGKKFQRISRKFRCTPISVPVIFFTNSATSFQK